MTATRSTARSLVRPGDATFGARTRRVASIRGAVYRAMFPATFAPGVRIGGGLTLQNPSQISVGAGAILSRGCMVACTRPTGDMRPSIAIGAKTFFNMGSVVAAQTNSVVIGDDVLFGPHTLVVDADHTFADPDVAIARQGMTDRGPVTIGDGAWIATGAVILGGTSIAPRSVVAANAVVRGDFPRRCVIAGAPARVVKYLD